MGRIRVSTVINATPAVVWEEVRHISRHVEWMADAESITFTTPQKDDVGTRFDCRTKVGPIRLTDRMEITEWRPEQAMGVRHTGLVTGTGVFTLESARKDRTKFTWDEQLTFPWWLGGTVGGFFGGFVMRRIWRQTLAVLKVLVESPRS